MTDWQGSFYSPKSHAYPARGWMAITGIYRRRRGAGGATDQWRGAGQTLDGWMVGIPRAFSDVMMMIITHSHFQETEWLSGTVRFYSGLLPSSSPSKSDEFVKKSQFPGQSNYSDLFGDVQIVNIQASPVILVSSRMPKKVKLIGSRVCYLYF